MKRLLLFCAVLALCCSSAEAAMTYGLSWYLPRRSAIGSGTSGDPLRQFINEVETAIEGATLEGGTTLTFSTYGGTFDNANNNAFEWNENTDELIWTFGSNTITVSSGDVTLFDFGTVKLGFDVFTVNAIDYTWPTSDGTGTYQLTTDGGGTLSWAAAGAGAGNTLDAAYDQGGGGVGRSITADTGAVAIATTDQDTGFLLTLGANPSGSSPLGGIEITLNTNSTENGIEFENTGSGDDLQGTGDVWAVNKSGVAVFASLTTTTTLASGTTLAAGSSLTVGTTLGVTGNTSLNGDVDLGNAITDTVSITGSIDADVYLDDESGASPSLIFKDATDETAAFSKTDAGTLSLTTQSDDGLIVNVGNVWIGNAAPVTAAMDGEDLFVEGQVEIDGTVQLDGLLTVAAGAALDGDITVSDEIVATLATDGEEWSIYGSATDFTADVGILTIRVAAQDNNVYALRLRAVANGDAENDFLVCEDTDGTADLFQINAGGDTTWLLDGGTNVQIDADSTINTLTTGVLDIDHQTATNGAKGSYLTTQIEDGATLIYGHYAYVNDDSAGTNETIHLFSANSDDGGTATVYGFYADTAVDIGLYTKVGAAEQGIYVDAATTEHTGTSGAVDIEYNSKTAGADAVNIKATHLTGGSGQTVSAIYVELDADSGNSSDYLIGLNIDASDSTATGKVRGIVIADSGAGGGFEEAILVSDGWVAIGDGSPGVTPGDDDLYVTGTIEADALVTLDAGLTVTGAAVNLNASSNFAVNIGTGSTTGTVTIGGAGAQIVAIGDGAAVKTVSLGSSNSTSTTTLLSGSGGLNLNVDNNQATNIGTGTTTGTVTIGGAGIQSIDIGNGAAAKTLALGSSNSTSTTTILSGSSGILLNKDNNQPTEIGTGTTTGTITIGGAGAQSINIGDGAAAKAVTLGSSNSTSTTTLLSGSGELNLNVDNNQATNIGTGSTTGTITIGGDGAQTLTIGNGAAIKTVTLGSSNTSSTTNILAGSGNINITGSVVRTSQQFVQTIGYCKVGTTGGWVVPAAADAIHLATLPQSQTNSTLIIPITIPLKVGYTITAWTINGQIDSGGNAATLDARLYKHTEATGGYANATIGSGMVQVAKAGDYKVVEGEASLTEVVAADESYYLLVTGTTAATTDIEIASITVTVSEI